MDRSEGLPTRRVEPQSHHTSVFVLTDKDGNQTPLMPARQAVGSGATPAAAAPSAENAFILGLGTNGKALKA